MLQFWRSLIASLRVTCSFFFFFLFPNSVINRESHIYALYQNDRPFSFSIKKLMFVIWFNKDIFHTSFPVTWQPHLSLAGVITELSKSYIDTQTHHTQQDSSGQVISPTQRPLSDNTQHIKQTDIHAPGGIRTRNPIKRAAEDLLLRQDDHRVQRYHTHKFLNLQ